MAFFLKDPTPNGGMMNWIECYDPSTNSSHRVTTIPGIENHVLKGFSMVAVGDSIYVIGGRKFSVTESAAGSSPLRHSHRHLV